MVYTLQLFHVADQEAGVPALDDAPRFSAVLNALRLEDIDSDGVEGFENTLTLSSGDAIIPGLFFAASDAAFGGPGRADILIQNELGIEAIAFGNHEFDQGTELVRDLIQSDAEAGFEGTDFPYLSSNLDFSTDENLADLVVPDAQAPEPNSIAASTVIDVNGELIGVVGATTPTIDNVDIRISNPGDVTVLPQPFDGNPTPGQLDALAAEIQTDVDVLLAANPDVNKVVVLSHMQQLSIEQELAARLTDVDIIVAGGSNTRLVDETDRLRAGDTDQGPYPILETSADGNPVAVVNTDGNYKYVGRLVVDFDDNGVIIPDSIDSAVSGAYATDEQGVADLGAEALVDPEIQTIVDALREEIVATESNVFGISDVYLNGVRGDVRTQETNLGNLTADANLAIAKETDPSVVISIKNGGGIRDDIGQLIVPPGGTEAEGFPTESVVDGDGNIVKPEGGISENDIVNTLRFNNGLTLLTATAEELVDIVEHAIAASAPGETPGRFPQVAGLEFDYIDTDPTLVGYELLNLNVVDGDAVTPIVANGEFVADPSQEFRLVTLDFLAGGGDGFPFPDRDVVELAQPEDAPRTGAATFAEEGTEQDALAEFLAANFDADNPYSEADTAIADDTRIQDAALTLTQDDNFVGSDADDVVVSGGTVAGGLGEDYIVGSDADDVLRGDLNSRSSQVGIGNDDVIFGGAGDDRIGGKGGNDILNGDSGDDAIWGDDGDDILRGGLGNDTLTGDDFSGGAGSDTFVLAAGEGTDTIVDFELGVDFIGLAGGITVDQLSFSGNTIELIGESVETLAVLTGVADASAVDFVAV